MFLWPRVFCHRFSSTRGAFSHSDSHNPSSALLHLPLLSNIHFPHTVAPSSVAMADVNQNLTRKSPFLEKEGICISELYVETFIDESFLQPPVSMCV